MTDHVVLYSKEGFVFSKNQKNNYSLTFEMENNHIILAKIIDFNLVKLMYDLNNDIYEKVNLKIINENEATINLLLKHLFEDLGFLQSFSYVHVKKISEENNISFDAQTIKSQTPEGMPENAELIPIRNMNCNCHIITQHKINFTFNVIFENHILIPQVLEKIVGLILYKIFNRLKLFIENVRM